MHRGARAASSTDRRPQRRSPSSAPAPASAAHPTPSQTASSVGSGGGDGGTGVNRARGGGQPGRPRSGRARGSGAGARRVSKPSPHTPPPTSSSSPSTDSARKDRVSLEEVLPTWKATRDVDLRRSNNVLFALGLQPINKKVARRILLIERNRMHGIMEGPSEDLTVAAVASDGLDGDHHHHHHHNGVSASLLANGGTSPPPAKDVLQPQPTAPPPASTAPAPTPTPASVPVPVADKKPEQESPPMTPVGDAQTEDAPVSSPKDSTDEKSDNPDTCLQDAKEDDSLLCVATVSEASSEHKEEKENTHSHKGDSDSNTCCSDAGAEGVNSEPETENETKESETLHSSLTVDEVETKIELETEETKPETEDTAQDDTPAEESDKEDVSNVSHGDEPVPESPEMSSISVKESSSVSEQDVRMEADDSPQPSITPPSKELKTSEDNQLSNESHAISITVSQKRSYEDDISDKQSKKQCLPDIVCNDANALDLSSIRKKDAKEPKIAVKPQSLLLSKLQGDSDTDKVKRESLFKDSSRGTESSRSTKISSAAGRTDRRRSSREEKERSLLGKRSNDAPNNRIAERDQVLREMRDKVLSSYKERDRIAKEDSLLRELLEPEREALLSELVESATINGGISELERVSAALESDIRVLTIEISNKEAEWNDLVRKRKLKEELALRVQRRKQVLVLAGDIEDEFSRRNSFEGDSRLDHKRESQLEARLEGRLDHREMPPKSGEELLAAALRLGSRNVEDYHHQRTAGSSPLAVRIQARANELLTGSTVYNERKPSGLLPGLSHVQPQSLLQSQLSKPSEISPTSSQSQFLLQHLQRQRVLMGAVSSSSSACRLSSSVSLSAIPTSTSTSSALSSSLPSTSTHIIKPSSRMDKQMSAPGCSRSQRPILPKPCAAAASGSSSLVVSDASLDATGGGIIGEGRQGPILDVKSIIADYRSKHPEGVPRRGRRMKTSGMVPENLMTSARPGSSSGGTLLSMSLPALGAGAQVRTGSSGFHADLSELGFVLTPGVGSDGPSRPSSTESTLSGAASQMNPDNGAGMSFKDVLVQFAKMTNVNDQSALTSSANLLGRSPAPQPHYPEVTLHPVVTPASASSPAPASSSPTTSLLHGILTKSSNTSASPALAKPTTFSPTLARLLTAPERSCNSSGGNHMVTSQVTAVPSFASTAGASPYPATGPVLLSDLLSGTSPNKTRSELTITPVTATSHMQSMTSTSVRGKQEVVVIDGEDGADVNGDDGDADTDSDERRLIIDEGDHPENGDNDGESSGSRLDRTRNSVPHCQGCNERDAEFVCAGCQRQWYCSRECQIAAWDEHSEVCFLPGASTADP